jgi:hypothetical protein
MVWAHSGNLPSSLLSSQNVKSVLPLSSLGSNKAEYLSSLMTRSSLPISKTTSSFSQDGVILSSSSSSSSTSSSTSCRRVCGVGSIGSDVEKRVVTLITDLPLNTSLSVDETLNEGRVFLQLNVAILSSSIFKK